MSVTYCEVALPVPLRSAFTYAIPDRLAGSIFVGSRVLVPFRNRAMTGVVVEVSSRRPDPARVKTIKEIHASGTTIVWIEHIVHALVSVASRLVVMNFGQVLAQGDPHEVMANARVREVYMGIPVS